LSGRGRQGHRWITDDDAAKGYSLEFGHHGAVAADLSITLAADPGAGQSGMN
jgi:hypothetical protein